MTDAITAHGGVPNSWTYDDVAALPVPPTVEDHLLLALKRLTASLDVVGVCDAVLDGVERAFGARASWIMLHDRSRDVLRTERVRGLGADAYSHVEVPVGEGMVGRVFVQGVIRFVPDTGRHHGWFDPERVAASGLQSVLLLPLLAGDRRLGLLALDAPRFAGDGPEALDLKRLEMFAAQAAVGLLHAQLYQASLLERQRLRALLRERRTLRHAVVTLHDVLRHSGAYGPIIGTSAVMQSVLAELEQVAASDVTVLLLGETGTGKELLARALHERSRRAARPFIPVNCAAMPEQLIESEMFGHERGSFTGAFARKPGRFEVAHRGTLCLDEIGDLPAPAQAKLLRVLQDGELYRVGATAPMKVDVRLVAATNRDLAASVADGQFREDLFYRLSVFPIRVPPLRERTEDIPDLARHLAAESSRRLGKQIREIEKSAIDELVSYRWPGNVRELRNVIERACILATDGVITADSVRIDVAIVPPRSPEVSAAASRPTPVSSTDRREPSTLADTERRAIIWALRETEGRISGPSGAAARLGLKPTTLHAKMKRLRVSRRDMLEM